MSTAHARGLDVSLAGILDWSVLDSNSILVIHSFVISKGPCL